MGAKIVSKIWRAAIKDTFALAVVEKMKNFLLGRVCG
jgi:hypothetical protein